MRRPNILWICTDQQRFDTLGCSGNRFVRTPNLDRLAADGVRFDHAYCQSPVCTPSRVSMLAGRYPRTAGCYQNGQNIPAHERLLTKLLSDAGYTCGLVGKLHVSACEPSIAPIIERRIDDGYSAFHWSHHPLADWPTNEYTHWLAERGASYTVASVAESRYVHAGMPAELHHTTWCAQTASAFIESPERAEKPWLCSVSIFDPHHPFDPPADYLQRYLPRLADIPLPNFSPGELENKPMVQRIDHRGAYGGLGGYPGSEMSAGDHRLLTSAYWAMCDLIDDAVGTMLQSLRRSGQLENTLVVFMSDHGEMLGDHGIYLKGPYFYEPAIRVPLIFNLPGTIAGGRRCDGMVELTDIAQTLMHAAGLEPAPGMQGRSLWPWLAGASAEAPARRDVYCEYYDALNCHRDPSAMATMLRTPSHKLVAFHADPADPRPALGELYDLESDPAETHNRWADPAHAAIKCDLLQRLCDRLAWTIDPANCRAASW